MRNLGSVRCSAPELSLYEKSATSNGYSSRSEWVRAALEHFINCGIRLDEFDRTLPVTDRLAKSGGGRNADMSSIRAPDEVVDGCETRARELDVHTAKWIRVALYLYADDVSK